MTGDIHQPVTPMPQLSTWAARLRDIARQPLEFCPGFSRIAERWEAWWAHDVLDRPIFHAEVNSNPPRPIDTPQELIADLDAGLEALVADLRQVHCVGDQVPSLPVGKIRPRTQPTGESVVMSGTVWARPTIKDDWSNAPAFSLDENGPDRDMKRELLRRVSRDAAGRYLVNCGEHPMGGDTLRGMRGSGKLALDVIEQPKHIVRAIKAYYPMWHCLVSEDYDIVTGEGAGLVSWTWVWSNWPYIVPQCDFSVMISTRHFERIFLPEIARQAATVGRAEFHLDGAEMVRHLDALLDIPEIQAVQYVTNTYAPSALPWLEAFRKVQRRGRSLHIDCPLEDILPLCDVLDPEGLAFMVRPRGRTAAEIDDLFAQFCHRFS